MKKKILLEQEAAPLPPFQCIVPNKFDFGVMEKKPIKKLVGLDSESYKNGQPFIFCTSDKDVFYFSDFPQSLFLDKYDGCDFVVWNMKYESGAILQTFMTPTELSELWKYGNARSGGYSVCYYPHKYLRLRFGSKVREIWDMAPFYNSSLDAAAFEYLRKRKMKMETKAFSVPYVNKNIGRLIKYCTRDAGLTAELGNLYLEKVKYIGVKPAALYSQASIAFSYFVTTKSRGYVDTRKLFDRIYCDELKLAHDSYQGGKMEIHVRGAIENAYEYDISSAYASELRNLISIHDCEIRNQKEYIEEADYGFISCTMRNHPVGLPGCRGKQDSGVLVFYAGKYDAILTKPEYEYLKSEGVNIKVHDAAWFISERKLHPFRSMVDHLFTIRKKHEGSDPLLAKIAKDTANAFYGRLCHLNSKIYNSRNFPHLDFMKDKNDEITIYTPDIAWNPIYASQITAKIRVRMCELELAAGPESCCAIHTDSIITRDPLPAHLLSSGEIGGLSLKASGPCLIIGCGQYEIGNKPPAHRGITNPKPGFTWRGLLTENPNRTIFPVEYTSVPSWIQACAWNRLEKINKFEQEEKEIRLDADVKRKWPRKRPTGLDLLTGGLEFSRQRILPEKI